MKRNYTKYFLILLALITYSTAYSQCTPNTNLTSMGVEPDELEPACVDKPYEETISYAVPKDTLINVGGFDQLADVDSVVINDVTNRPTGLDYTCNNNCVLIPDQNQELTYGCILISGTPTEANTDEDSLEVHLTLHGFGGAVSYPITYKIAFRVYGANEGPCLVGINDRMEAKRLEIYPNPGNSGDLVKFASPVTEVKLYDSLGTLIYEANKASALNTSTLESGIYFIQASEGTTRLVID